MGIKSYFKTEGKQRKEKPATAHVVPNHPQPAPPSENEKGHVPDINRNDMELQPPVLTFDSSRNSTHSERSRQSVSGSGFLDDIRHQVMVTHIYQQQCSACWVGDETGEIEGVVLRKTKRQYLTCPASLIDSPFAAACAALNVQVLSPFVSANL